MRKKFKKQFKLRAMNQTLYNKVHKPTSTSGIRRHAKAIPMPVFTKNNERGAVLHHGSIGIRTLQSGYVKDSQLEMLRLHMKKNHKGINIYTPVKSNMNTITRKAIGTRMGSGIGGVDHKSSTIKEGRIVVSIEGLAPEVVRKSLDKLRYKFGFKSKLVVESEETACNLFGVYIKQKTIECNKIGE